jgi:hypothetical protein
MRKSVLLKIKTVALIREMRCEICDPGRVTINRFGSSDAGSALVTIAVETCGGPGAIILKGAISNLVVII